MGKSTAKRRIKADRGPPVVKLEQDATPERLRMVGAGIVEALRSKGERMAKVRRLVPPIDTLLAAGKLTEDEHRALTYYRDQADTANKSPIRDSLNKTVSGGGEQGLSAAVVSAVLATSRIERDMGQLSDIARAVAVEDVTIAQWCIRKHGGRERYDGKGRFVCVVPLREVEVTKIAVMELRMAAHRIVR
uniref:hypothetical protein n=1 Tax=uncultured Sphingomonas sp. TaxID=158754 RepID=UPI0035CC1ADB